MAPTRTCSTTCSFDPSFGVASPIIVDQLTTRWTGRVDAEDPTGKACPSGVGLSQPGAKLATTPLSHDPSTLHTSGLPSDMCILRGFPTDLAKRSTDDTLPFGIWFANPHTLYVADEGNGDTSHDAATNTCTTAAASSHAGLQKCVYDSTGQTWNLSYPLARSAESCAGP